MTKSLKKSVSTLNKKSVFEKSLLVYYKLALVIWIGNWATDIAGGINLGMPCFGFIDE
jgi:hypothetical protein